MVKLNLKSISLGKKLSFGLGTLLFSTITNFNCVFHTQKVMDLRKISIEEILKNYSSYKSVNHNISALDYRALLLSLNHAGLGIEVVEEIKNNILLNQNEILSLFKKHKVSPENFYKHSVMVLLKENPHYLNPEEVNLAKDLKKYLLLNEKQMTKLQELKGGFSRTRFVFREDDFVIGSVWILFIISVFIEMKRKNPIGKEALADFDRSPRALLTFISAMILLSYYSFNGLETIIDKARDKDDMTYKSLSSNDER
jgi:hypothetical protein